MKRIFLAVSMVTLFAAGAAAQGISGGLKAGLNLANINGDDVEDTDLKMCRLKAIVDSLAVDQHLSPTLPSQDLHFH